MTEQEKLEYLMACWQRYLESGGDPTIAAVEWHVEAE